MEGATPRFLALVRHRGGVSGPPFGPPLTPPLGGVAPTTVIPAGRRPGSVDRVELRDAINSRSRMAMYYSWAGKKAPSPLRSPGLPPSLITP